MLNKNTFGKTDAAVILADLLNKAANIKQQRSVSRFLQMHGEIQAGYVKHVQGTPLADMFRRNWARDITEASLVGLDRKVETYMKNVAMAKIPQS